MKIAFVGGPVIVGDGRILETATVLVDDAHIVSVETGDKPVPSDARVVTLSGRTLLPGFIDCHVHVCLDASPDPISASMMETLPITALKAARSAWNTLMAGVTTVRDMGGKDGIDLGLKQAVQSGLVPGPRMLVSGRLICMTGGHGWQIGLEADGPTQVRKAAREQIKAGADIVKLMATGGVMTPAVEPGSEQLTEEEMRAGIEEAHKAGRKTATHAMGTRGILNALHAGIDSIEHGVYLNEEAVSFMVENHIPYIPTLSALFNIEANGLQAGIPRFAVDKTTAVKPHHLASVQMAKAAGVPVAMGTDAGTPFNRHGENLAELVHLVEQGFSPMEAIQCGTRIAAETLGMGNRIGTIEAGKLADLVVVSGNPLDDIELLRRGEAIDMVIQEGRLVKGNWE